MEKQGLMQIHVVVICAVVGVLGLITVILGIAAAASTAKDGGYSAAQGCGIVAALFALTGQIVVTAASGCCGCCQTWGIPTEIKRIVAVVLNGFSWLLVIIDVVLFILGAVADTGGAFAPATVMSLVAVGFQITSYILLQLTAASSAKPLEEQQSWIAVGQPIQPEPQNADQQAAAGGDPTNSGAYLVVGMQS